LLGRYRHGRELSAYLVAELGRGRGLYEVLSDDAVRARLAAEPYRLDDLASDQLVREAALSQGSTHTSMSMKGMVSPMTTQALNDAEAAAERVLVELEAGRVHEARDHARELNSLVHEPDPAGGRTACWQRCGYGPRPSRGWPPGRRRQSR